MSGLFNLIAKNLFSFMLVEPGDIFIVPANLGSSGVRRLSEFLPECKIVVHDLDKYVLIRRGEVVNDVKSNNT